MKNRQLRSASSPTTSRTRRTSAPARLFERVGLALGLPDPAHAAGLGSFESLENRAMLEGSFLDAIVINLDPDGEGSAPGAIDPSVPDTDADFYQFVAPANDFVRVLADTANEDPASLLNTRVSVFDDTFALVASGTSNGTLTTGVQRDGFTGFIAQQGRTYYVVVASDNTQGPQAPLPTANTYTLRIDGTSSTFILDPDGTGIAIDPGTPPPPPPLLPAIPGNLDLRQDDEVWRYTAATTSLVTVNAQHNIYNPPFLPGSSVPDRLDTRVEIYNAAGVIIASDSDAGRINDAFATFRAVQGEEYFIRVRSDEVRPIRRPNDPAFDATLATGPFSLVVDTDSQAVPLNQVTRRGISNDAFAGFDDPINPSTLPTPSFQTKNFTFEAAGDGLAIITVTPTGLAPVTDPAVRLFDSDGNLIAYNDNFAGLSAQLEVRLVGGQDYYVVVDGFEINSAVQFILNIEANHTNTQSNDTLVDDHVNTPVLSDTPTPEEINQARRIFGIATGLTFNAPAPVLDGNRNEIRDRGLRVTATATGRLHDGADTDLFQFTPPTDMLLDYAGNNDDTGLSMFIGGIFDSGSNNSQWPTRSRNLTTWDANDYWYTGPQYFDENFEVTYGFNDNPDTVTVGAEIYSLTDYDPGVPVTPPAGMSRRWLVVGGDFDLIIPSPFGPVTIKNLAVWAQDFNTGQWGWGSLGDVNGPVRASASYLPDTEIPRLTNPGENIPTDGPQAGGVAVPYLVIGGLFTDVDGTAVSNLATFDVANGWQDLNGGTDGQVNAITVYNPPDAGAERAAAPGPPILPGVAESRDIPNSLFFGGDFAAAAGLPVNNLAYWDGVDIDNVWGGPFDSFRSGAGPNGPVHALTTFTGWDPDGVGEPGDQPGEIEDPGTVLIVGGEFSAIADGEGVNIPAANIAAWGFIGAFPGFNRDPADPDYGPQLNWLQVDDGLGTPNSAGDPAAVYALTQWDPPNINNGDDEDFPPILVIGGAFTAANGMENLTGFAVDIAADPVVALGFGWLNDSVGTNGIVRALATSRQAGGSNVDEQEPGIATDLNSGVPQEVLYVAGEFTEVTNGNPNDPVFANRVAQFAAFNDPLSGQDFFAFTAMQGGVGNLDPDAPAPVVFALAAFDDGNPLDWDRHDRPATRLDITVSPASDSFANMRVRVYDSSMNIVFGFNEDGSETKAPPFPDPAGMIDPSLAAPPLVPELEGIKLWGGETYYIEVSALGGTDDDNTFVRGGSGRYTMTVIADAWAPDLNGDDLFDDVNANVFGEPIEGRFTQAIALNPPLGTGDTSNFVQANTPPLHGNSFRQQRINPSTNLAFTTAGDIGNITSLTDADLYSFRAQFSGFVEVRISTSLINDAFGEQYGNDFRGDSKVISSWLDSALRVFRNDFEQIAYNDDNAAITGDFADMPFATLGDRRFYSRDARVLIPVTAGNVYYIQVESGGAFADATDPDIEDRLPNIARETDVRRATGAYELLLNAMPQLNNDIEGGQTVFDDHAQGSGALGTPILIGDMTSGSQNGRGTFTGIINNTPLFPIDQDFFQFITPGAGPLRIDLTRTQGSSLNIDAVLFRVGPGGGLIFAAAGTPQGLGGSRIDFDARAGELYVLEISGTGNTEGGYQGVISGVPDVDDHADFAKLEDATDLVLLDFLGQAQDTGSIEKTGDTDLFRFSFEDFFSSITVDVTALDATLNPTVSIYEVSEDPSGNPMLLRVGFNDNASAGTTTARVTVPITPDRAKEPPNAPPRPYPYYYIVVQGADPAADQGRYTIGLTFPGTDDHPDAVPEAAPAPATVDTTEFGFATRIVIDSATGLGNAPGSVERVGDTDLLQFTAPAGGVAEVLIDRPLGSLIRTRVFITDADGNVITSDTAQDSTTSTTAVVTFNVLRNTTYFIVVEGFEDSADPNVNTTVTGDYTISVTAPPIDDHPNAGEFGIATGLNFNVQTGVAQIGGDEASDPSNPRLSPLNDTDLFTLTTLLSGNQVITVTPFDADGTFSPSITVFDEAFNQIAFASGAAALEEVSLTLSSVPAGTRLYILVGAVSGIGDQTGEYRLRLAGPLPGGGGGGPDPAEIDFNAPLLLTLDGRTGDGDRFDSISPSGDRDLFTFTTDAAGRVFVQVVTPNGSLLDASVRILNAVPVDSNANGVFDDAELDLVTVPGGFDSDGVPGATSDADFLATGNSQYWIVVDGLGDSVGSYQVRINTQPLVNRLFFPEGFSNTNIREFLSIINPNSVDANYTVYIRYEWDILETIIGSGVVPANSRDGLTLIDGPFSQIPGILHNVPYAIIIDSDQPLGATLARYDFGSAVGDSFTETLSPTWNFAQVRRDPGEARDFIVFYNPNNFDIDVTLTAYQNGQQVSITRRFDALRRGGFAIDDITSFPSGTFGVVLTAAPVSSSDQPAFLGVVASISHYSISGDSAYAVLGTPVTPDNPLGGSLEGVMTNIMQGPGVSSEVVFFNPGSTTATVTLTGAYIRTPGLPAFTRIFDVAPRSLFTLSGASLGLINDQPVGVAWTSSVPVNALASEQQFGDGDATQPATVAARQFYFGDAYIDVAQAGQLYFETLFFYNPANTPSSVAVRLVFFDGTESTFNVSIPARGYQEVKLHERPEITQQRSGRQWFAVDASSTLPFIASMQHYDLFLGGGWATSGIPFGLTNPLSRIS